MKAAIQGELGSFSHQAALKIVPQCQVVPCQVSRQVFDALQSGKVDAAVIPIENSLAGSVTEHFDLLLEYAAYIEREQPLRIVHNLIAAPGVEMRDVRRVLSHPVALAQCRNLFRKQPKFKAEPFYDTAGAVKHVISERLGDAAAIASALAAAEYGGVVLKRGVEDNKRNVTRFLLIRRLRALKIPVQTRANKTSIAFSLKNRAGALYAALSIFAQAGISLSKIESRPVPGKPWEYIFYADLLAGDTSSCRSVIAQLKKSAQFVKVLGIYRSAT